MGAELLRLPQAALFDWDNTLVDTWPVIHEAMNTTLSAMGRGLEFGRNQDAGAPCPA